MPRSSRQPRPARSPHAVTDFQRHVDEAVRFSSGLFIDVQGVTPTRRLDGRQRRRSQQASRFLPIFPPIARSTWTPATASSHGQRPVGQPAAERVPRAVFRRDAEAADIPANRAACRTPLPSVRAILAFSTLALTIGGRPNLMDKLRAAD
jgi:hypothetical protein